MGERMSRTKRKFSEWSVFAGCLILMIFPGGMMSYTAGLFMYPICEEFGFSVTAYSMVLTLTAVVNALVSAFLVGYLSKGSRKTMKIIIPALFGQFRKIDTFSVYTDRSTGLHPPRFESQATQLSC